MQSTAQRYFWVVTVLFVALAAHLGARLSSQILARSLQPAETVQVRAKVEQTTVSQAEGLAQYRVIQDRNLFNADPKPLQATPTTPKTPAAGQPAAAPPKLKVTLVGTGLRSEGVSFAIFEVEGKNELVHVGGEVAPEAKLVEVQNDRVYINYRGTREEHLLFVDRPEKNIPKRPDRYNRKNPRRTAAKAQESDTIRQVDATSWVIDQREIDNAVVNINQLMTQIRVVPNLGPGGQADGFKVFSIRPNSIFARIGLRNGDILKEVDGTPLTGIDQGLLLFQQFQQGGSTSHQINLIRQNQPVTHNYEIR